MTNGFIELFRRPVHNVCPASFGIDPAFVGSLVGVVVITVFVVFDVVSVVPIIVLIIFGYGDDVRLNINAFFYMAYLSHMRRRNTMRRRGKLMSYFRHGNEHKS